MTVCLTEDLATAQQLYVTMSFCARRDSNRILGGAFPTQPEAPIPDLPASTQEAEDLANKQVAELLARHVPAMAAAVGIRAPRTFRATDTCYKAGPGEFAPTVDIHHHVGLSADPRAVFVVFPTVPGTAPAQFRELVANVARHRLIVTAPAYPDGYMRGVADLWDGPTYFLLHDQAGDFVMA